MAIRKTEAFVLKTQPFRSSSLIVTLFSQRMGKMKGIAKGVRRERETRGALYELFTHLDIVFYEKQRSDLHLISEAAIVDSHENLRSRLETIAYASYFSELVDVLTEIYDPHESLFSLLDVAYRYLPAIPGEKIARLFEVRLLREIGWLPYLQSCLKCRQASFRDPFFSVAQGAVVCGDCRRVFPDARPLSEKALHAMRYYAGHGLEESLKIPTTVSVDQELRGLLESFLLYRLNNPFKSRQFLEQIRPALS